MGTSLQELAENYVQRCTVIRNYAPHTVKGYQSTFKLFFKETGLKSLDELTFRVFENWFFNGRLNRKWSAVTFRTHLKHLNLISQNSYSLKNRTMEKLEKIEKTFTFLGAIAATLGALLFARGLASDIQLGYMIICTVQGLVLWGKLAHIYNRK